MRLTLALVFQLALVCGLSIRGEAECAQVYGTPFDQQCHHVQTHCGDVGNLGIVDYLSLYYCRFHFHNTAISLSPLIATLVVLFTALGLTALDYLCPNLYTISKFLHLSDNLAGLTLLALGNSAPDVLSTYQAMSIDAGSLALSELMGAAFFITTVVIGTMALVHPFQVPKSLFMRDAGFFLCVTCLLFVSLADSFLSLWNLVVLIAVYVLYVVVVVFLHSLRRAKSRRDRRAHLARSEYRDDISLVTMNPVEDDEAVTGSYGLKILLKELQKHSNLSSPVETFKRYSDEPEREDIEDAVGTGSDQADTNTSGSNGTFHYSDEPHSSDSNELTSRSDEPLTSMSNEFTSHSDEPSMSNEPTSIPQVSTTANPSDNPSIVLTVDRDDLEIQRELHDYIDYASHQHFGTLHKRLLIKLLVPQLEGFSTFNLSTKIYTVLAFPAAFLLRISSPVRDHEMIKFLQEKERMTLSLAPVDLDFDFTLDRQLLTIQTFIAVNFVSYNALSGLSFYWPVVFPMAFLVSVATAFLVQRYYVIRGNEVVYDHLFTLKIINHVQAVVGFLVLVSWIAVFANEIISILKAATIILHLSDDLLGVTVFAVGNSIGDFISNYTIASMGMPLMAIGACFGGPLLLISSMGLSTIIVAGDKHGYDIQKTPTINIISVSLILNIALLLLIVPYNSWMLDRKIGVVLVMNWVLVTALCLLRD